MSFNITYVPQPNFYTCDHACLAMITNIPIEEAISVMEKNKSSGSSAFYKALKKYKIDYLSWRSIDNVQGLPPLCVLLVEFPTYNHSVLYYDGIYYDPEFGVLDTYTPAGRITHYMEIFIEEIYEGRKINVNIPPDLQEEFKNDHEAYEIFIQLSYPEKSKYINKISHFKNPLVRKNNIEKILKVDQIEVTLRRRGHLITPYSRIGLRPRSQKRFRRSG